MMREDVQDFLATIQVAYPNWKPADKSATINLWTIAIAEYTKEEAMQAFLEYAKTENTGFAPSIGQIVNLIKEQKERAYFEKLEQMLLADIYKEIETEQGEIKALEAHTEGVEMPEHIKKRLEEWKNEID